MSTGADAYKVKDLSKGGGGFAKYRALVYGDLSLGRVIAWEFAMLFFGGVPGALGYALRGFFYRKLIPGCARKVVFGRNVTIRHPGKIRIGEGTVIDDNAVVDAKGDSNRGIEIGRGVFIGRNTIVYCKNGNIRIGDRVNISSNCQVFSSNDLSIGDGTVIGAFCYLLSGGEYDAASPVPFCEQSGTITRGPLTVGANCWLGAHVTVRDGACVGDHCVLAAGAVVVKPVPPDSVAGGVPAQVLKSLKNPA